MPVNDPRAAARRVARALVLAAVCVLHVAAWRSIVCGAAEAPAPPKAPAIRVTFVRALEPAPPLAPRSMDVPPPASLKPPALAVPQIDAAGPSPVVAGAGMRTAETSTLDAATAPPAPWPPSMRLVYAATWQAGGLTTHGTVVLDWRRDADRYEIDLTAQPDLVMPFHLASEGGIAGDELLPRRFVRDVAPAAGLPHDEVTYELDRMRLADGRTFARPPDSQDPASELMDAAHAFALHPEWLDFGRTIDRPIAAPGRVGRWLVDPQPAEPVESGWGRVECTRLAAHAPLADWGAERPAEACLAPALAGLPVRLAWTFASGATLTLSLARPPLQAEATAAQQDAAR
jgi:hypothetical protein